MNLSAAVAKVENEPTKLALRSAFTFTRATTWSTAATASTA